MNNPQLSVILLPVPGGNPQRALQAILSSQFRDLEVLVAAHVSPPPGEERVRTLPQYSSAELAEAALQAAAGDYIHIHEDDGAVGPDFYARLLERAASQHSEIIRGEAHQFRNGRCIGETRIAGHITRLGPAIFDNCIWTALLQRDFLHRLDLHCGHSSWHPELVLLTAAALTCRSLENVPGVFYDWYPVAELPHLTNAEAAAIRQTTLERAALLDRHAQFISPQLLRELRAHLAQQLSGTAQRLPAYEPLRHTLQNDIRELVHSSPAAQQPSPALLTPAPQDVAGQLAALRHELAELKTLINSRFDGYIAAFHRTADVCYADEDVRLMQQARLVTLRAFDALCRTAGLDYFLYAGTLLGAIRHGGYIPWDDEISVGLEREAYERLRQEMLRRSRESGELHEVISASGAHTARYSICDPRLTVDLNIYIHDRCQGTPQEVCRLLDHQSESLQQNIAAVLNRHGVTHKEVCAPLGHDCGPLWSDLRAVEDRHVRSCGAAPGAAGSSANLTLPHHERCIAITPNELLPLGTARFENLELPIPHDPDALLRAQYGNYHALPANLGLPQHPVRDRTTLHQLRAFIERHPVP